MNIKKFVLASAVSTLILGQAPTAMAVDLDAASATVSMNVAQFATLTGLDSFVLTTGGTDGASGAAYTGSDIFNLESNSQVRVTLTGSNLAAANGDTISTAYSLDGGGGTFDTTVSVAHNAPHTVAATGTLGAISAQVAGAYSTVITLTVSTILI